LADRLSANIELPKASDLAALAPEKKLVTIENTMQQIRVKVDEAEQERAKTRHAPAFARAGQSTQLVVGATESTDRDILTTASHLYSAYKLKRIYYSGFSPFPKADARLPLQAAPLVREHRLYQADWLVRYYGFEASELTTSAEPNFHATEDPKLSWALRHREFFPVDVNVAPREHLLRIPGLGYRNVQRLLSVRRYHRLTLADLAKLRVSLNRAKPFIVAADYDSSALRIDSPALPRSILAPPQQLALFASASAAVSGEI
ncbi:MAG: biotin synthase, partial [Acidobacteriales bacterium]|nr:biotin synthase [Terriglobales bacterium]